VKKSVVSKCFASLVLGFAGAACGQEHVIIEVIPVGQLIGPYQSTLTETYVVIEDRLVEERLLIDGVLQGKIIEPAVPLASERMESAATPVVNPPATEVGKSVVVPATSSKDQFADAIAEMAARSVKLQEELASLKELLQKHVETAGEQQQTVVAKLAEAIKERDDARTQFEASLKEFALRNEQVTTLAVGLREAYERLEAKRAESGEVAEKSVAMVDELRGQVDSLAGSVKKVDGEVAKNAQETEKVVDRVEGVAGHLKSIQSEVGENAESVEKLKSMISTLEDRVKAMEKNRGKSKPKKDE